MFSSKRNVNSTTSRYVCTCYIGNMTDISLHFLIYSRTWSWSVEREDSALSDDIKSLCNTTSHSPNRTEAPSVSDITVIVALSLFLSSYNAAACHSCSLCIILKWSVQPVTLAVVSVQSCTSLTLKKLCFASPIRIQTFDWWIIWPYTSILLGLMCVLRG